jgi:protein-disulfide isomerase
LRAWVHAYVRNDTDLTVHFRQIWCELFWRLLMNCYLTTAIQSPVQTGSFLQTHVAGLSADDHALGLDDAPITLLEYGDYECPFCAKVEPKVRLLVETFGPQLRFVFRHLPLLELHPHAELAAEAAEAAAAQGGFWAMHRLLFASPHHLTMDDLAKHAQTIGLDMIRFHADMADHIYTQRVQEHRRAAGLSDFDTTPTFILNGIVIDTSADFEVVVKAAHALRRPHVAKNGGLRSAVIQ